VLAGFVCISIYAAYLGYLSLLAWACGNGSRGGILHRDLGCYGRIFSPIGWGCAEEPPSLATAPPCGDAPTKLPLVR